MKRIMKKKLVLLILILLSLPILFTGCGGIINPYKGEFACPQSEKGKCVGIIQAYEEVIKLEEEAKKKEKERGNGSNVGNNTFSLFEKEMEEEILKEQLLIKKHLFEKMSGLLRDPQTPILVSPQVIRILILPYAQGKNLYMGRYIYVMLEEPRWVFENLLKEGWEKE